MNLPRVPPERITAADLARHRIAIERFRCKLFEHYSPADYSIIPGTEETIAPTARFTIQIWDNAIDRQVALGGLRYEYSSPRRGIRRWIEVRHVKGSSFRFFGIWQDEGRRFVRFALDADFDEIAEVVYRCIRATYEEDAQFLPEQAQHKNRSEARPSP